MLAVGIVAVFLITLAISWLLFKIVPQLRTYRKWHRTLDDQLPHNPIHPLWGNLHQITTPTEFQQKNLKFIADGAKSFIYWVGFSHPVVNVGHPETLKAIMRTSEPKTKGGGGYNFLYPWLGDGLLVSHGKKWERNRRLLTPAFHFDILKPYTKIYNQSTEGFMKIPFLCESGLQIIQTVCIEIHKNDPDLLKKRHLDFLDILLSARDETEQGLTDKEIRDEVDTFMFEGHDTTSSAISWCLYCLARYPDVQQKVLQEVQEIIGDKKEVEWDDLGRLHYVPMFIKESMRLYPPVPLVGRTLSQPLVIDGVELPEGVSIDINMYHAHRNPNVWSDCLEFEPERFDPDTSAGRDPYCFVPFSAGPRNCIGQNFAMNEIKVMVCQVVRRFQIDLDPEKEAKPMLEIVLRSESGLYLKFSPRT